MARALALRGRPLRLASAASTSSLYARTNSAWSTRPEPSASMTAHARRSASSRSAVSIAAVSRPNSASWAPKVGEPCCLLALPWVDASSAAKSMSSAPHALPSTRSHFETRARSSRDESRLAEDRRVSETDDCAPSDLAAPIDLVDATVRGADWRDESSEPSFETSSGPASHENDRDRAGLRDAGPPGCIDSIASWSRRSSSVQTSPSTRCSHR
mmetsp:Transcript_26697/g.106915  ORF Transcript_26697/g.106915 Transcript_26697/m.106915 type:complete len:214 (-) Transcript_26697:1250-1891(-)